MACKVRVVSARRPLGDSHFLRGTFRAGQELGFRQPEEHEHLGHDSLRFCFRGLASLARVMIGVGFTLDPVEQTGQKLVAAEAPAAPQESVDRARIVRSLAGGLHSAREFQTRPVIVGRESVFAEQAIGPQPGGTLRRRAEESGVAAPGVFLQGAVRLQQTGD